jgi:hypothetical protein
LRRVAATKAAIQLHTLLHLRGAIPAFIHISDGMLNEVNGLDLLAFEAGAFYGMDRGHLAFTRLDALHLAGACFVTREKSPMGCPACVLGRHRPQHGRHQRPAGHALRVLLGQETPLCVQALNCSPFKHLF